MSPSETWIRSDAFASSRSICSDRSRSRFRSRSRDLVQRPAPLGRVRLELRGGVLVHVLRLLVELRAEPRRQRLLLVGGALDALRVLLDLRLDLLHPQLLALRQPRQLVGEPLLRALQVVRPRRQPLLEPLAHRRQRLRELRVRLALALGHVAPALVGDPALLLGEQRERLGAGARERLLELDRARARLLLDGFSELGAGALDLVVDRADAVEQPPQRERAGGDRDRGGRAERREGDPPRRRRTRTGPRSRRPRRRARP